MTEKENLQLPGCMAFTSKSKNGVLNSLRNEVSVFNTTNDSIKGIALWDTGASGTCISSNVVDKLGLVATGCTVINTPAGAKDVGTYLISLLLPNSLRIDDICVCETDIGDQGIDVLIGMDIISLGDFCVSNFNKSTTFTFRFPSQEETDYVKTIRIKKTIGEKHGPGKRKKKRK